MKSALISLALKQLMKYLIIRAPFLAWGPINAVVSYFLEKLLVKIVDETVLGIAIYNIISKTDSQVRDVNVIVDKLKDDSLGEIEKRKLDYDLEKAFIDLIRFN